MIDKICRRNGITHRLTQPASPNQNGKVERFHGTLRPEIEPAGPFETLAAAQAAVDGWVAEYNAERPHQALNPREPSCRRTGSRPPSRWAGAVAARLARGRCSISGSRARPDASAGREHRGRTAALIGVAARHGRADRTGLGRAAVGEHVGAPLAVLARPRPRR